jgi:lipopolysaccharide transport system permease protein
MKLLRFFISPFLLLIKYKNLIVATSKNDIRSRYAGSFLGRVWLILYPLLLLGAYAAVYIYIFKVKFQLFNTNEYVLLIFCGLVPFLGFADALSNGVGSVVSNSNLIKNTLFPIELIPVKSVIVSQITQVVGMGILLISLMIFGKVSLWLPFSLIIWIFELLFLIGVTWILSSINVFVRDLQSIVSVVVMLTMMLSPIAYTEDMIPPELKPFLILNPVYYITASFQDVLMFGHFPRGNVFYGLIGTSLFTFLFGYWFFIKLKRVFIDNV